MTITISIGTETYFNQSTISQCTVNLAKRRCLFEFMENAKLNSLAAAAAQANTDRLAASVVRSLSPGSLNPSTSSSQTGSPNFNHKISGIPCVAAASRYTAPVHIDVGGTIYTSSLETLTK